MIKKILLTWLQLFVIVTAIHYLMAFINKGYEPTSMLITLPVSAAIAVAVELIRKKQKDNNDEQV
jgi:hypothetical protein